MQRMIQGFVAILVAVGAVACAHDPDPFARERSIEEEKQDERQALQASQHEMDRQQAEAARRDDGEQDGQEGRQQAQDDGESAGQADDQAARQRVRDVNATVRRMELPRLPTSQVITVPRVLGR